MHAVEDSEKPIDFSFPGVAIEADERETLETDSNCTGGVVGFRTERIRTTKAALPEDCSAATHVSAKPVDVSRWRKVTVEVKLGDESFDPTHLLIGMPGFGEGENVEANFQNSLHNNLKPVSVEDGNVEGSAVNVGVGVGKSRRRTW